jgi:DNA topoisomerase-1
MLIKWGRNGRFLSCSKYPKCKNAQPLPGEQEEHQELAEGKFCSLCAARRWLLNPVNTVNSSAAQDYPECRNIQPITLGHKMPQVR